MSTQLLNDPRTLVTESLEGLVATTPHLQLLEGSPDINVVIDSQHDKSKVAIISGGGSGHEPAHAGYVGCGMLAAAVAGQVFASPSAEAVLAAILAVSGGAGCLLVVKNYTGDRLNFGLAAEAAKAAGVPVEMVVVGEDCAIAAPGLAGRRGLAGTVLVHKVAGAAAAAGAPLAEVAALARGVVGGCGTLGVALRVCSLPGQAPSTRLPPGQVELGLGIHGEPGVKQLPGAPAGELVREMVRGVVDFRLAHTPSSSSAGGAAAAAGAGGGDGSSSSSGLFPPGSAVVLLVNNLGATPPLEMGVVAREALAAAAEHQLEVARVYVGPFMTSLDMAGASITLLQLAPPGSNSTLTQQLLSLLDAPTAAPHWPKGPATPRPLGAPPVPLPPQVAALVAKEVVAPYTGDLDAAAQQLRACLTAVADSLTAAAPQLNAADSKVGDGDCGSTLAAGAAALQQRLQANTLYVYQPAVAMRQVAAIVQHSMGGTSGGLYGVGLTAAAASLISSSSSGGGGKGEQGLGLQQWAAAFKAGVAAVERYGGAGRGARTMVDAAAPAAAALEEAAAAGLPAAAAAAAAAQAAEAGAAATAQMAVAQAGRSSYVPAAALTGTPDPGAMAVAIWLSAVAQQLGKQTQ